MAIIINNLTMPDSLNAKGDSNPPAPVALGHNGESEAVIGGARVVEFAYTSLSQSDFDWWYTTILAGETSKKFTQASIPGLGGSAEVYTDVTVELSTGPQRNRRGRNSRLHNIRVVVTLR